LKLSSVSFGFIKNQNIIFEYTGLKSERFGRFENNFEFLNILFFCFFLKSRQISLHQNHRSD